MAEKEQILDHFVIVKDDIAKQNKLLVKERFCWVAIPLGSGRLAHGLRHIKSLPRPLAQEVTENPGKTLMLAESDNQITKFPLILIFPDNDDGSATLAFTSSFQQMNQKDQVTLVTAAVWRGALRYPETVKRKLKIFSATGSEETNTKIAQLFEWFNGGERKLEEVESKAKRFFYKRIDIYQDVSDDENIRSWRRWVAQEMKNRGLLPVNNVDAANNEVRVKIFPIQNNGAHGISYGKSVLETTFNLGNRGAIEIGRLRGDGFDNLGPDGQTAALAYLGMQLQMVKRLAYDEEPPNKLQLGLIFVDAFSNANRFLAAKLS